jgi:DNA adenine methylase
LKQEPEGVAMAQFVSPLRYPGGKRKLAPFVDDLIIQNNMQNGTYVEPFAGGASVALYLLFKESVKQVVINDFDRSIYAFWYSATNSTEDLCRRIRDIGVTVDEWERQKKVQGKKSEADLLDLGFSTFFLNRTNRSGIMDGGIIGGRRQSGDWRMDARFNKDDLIKRIARVGAYRDRIEVYNEDAMAFVDDIKSSIDARTLIYFDPPYYNQGSALYANHYTHRDHELLAQYIQHLDCRWMLTYDNTPQIVSMYDKAERRLLSLNYTAARKGRGYEMLAFSTGLTIPQGCYPSVLIE